MAVIIQRHCVESLPESGLSPLQTALLEDRRPVRIAGAPTGAGKTYAFEQAVARDPKQGEETRVLFIVPTRRLAQNIVHGLTASLVRNHGWSTDRAERKVALWTGDASKDYYEAGGRDVTARRINQIYRLDDAPGGEMIVTVPEILSYLLVGRWPGAGQASDGVFTFLNQFDHIVFDEFHTISARGFGLAALFARLATGNKGKSYGRAKVSFLSATPLNILPVLQRCGIQSESIVELQEKIGDHGRAVHGDVLLTACREIDMVSMFAARLDVVRNELADQGQVVLIYDSLADLRRQLPRLETELIRAGVRPGETLLVNSIDDSAFHATEALPGDGFFRSGCHYNPLDFKMLVATASVEMGVTFKTRLLFMEPGFEAMNFLQRYGRAARGDVGGQVFARIDEIDCKRRPWLRQLNAWLTEHAEKQVEIHELTTVLARSVRQRFKDEQDETSFGALSMRAAYSSGLYWNVLQNHFSNQGPVGRHLYACRMQTARTINVLLRQVRQMVEDPYYTESATRWCDGFEAQAAILRDIGRRIRVIEENGRSLSVELHWLRQQTDLLERYPITIDENGEEELCIEGRLDDGLLPASRYIPRLCTVRFPHTNLCATIEDNGFLPDQWRRELRQHREAEEAREYFPESMAAAEKLVMYTGLVVTDDDEFSMDAGNVVL